jgi:DMSO/TMAO reductase YedYZ molybdopterin-dependent catalytic subunit
MAIINRGFGRRRPEPAEGARLPPGQYLTHDFPVLSAGPTPHTDLAEWTFTVGEEARWSWEQFLALPAETPTVDIHCVTSWSKFDTSWKGVSVDTLFRGLEVEKYDGFATAYCDGGYTTNLPLSDLTGGKAWVVYEYDGEPLPPAHGGPARLLVPHLYFWKSAKWVRGIRFHEEDEPGFWETLGYHDRGDPWREQRYQGD